MGLGGAITAVLVIMVGMGLRWSLRNNQLSNYYAPITSAVLGMPWSAIIRGVLSRPTP